MQPIYDHYVPAAGGGHRLRCRCWLCQRYPTRTQRALRALRGAGVYAAGAAACIAFLALGAWLDAV